MHESNTIMSLYWQWHSCHMPLVQPIDPELEWAADWSYLLSIVYIARRRHPYIESLPTLWYRCTIAGIIAHVSDAYWRRKSRPHASMGDNHHLATRHSRESERRYTRIGGFLSSFQFHFRTSVFTVERFPLEIATRQKHVRRCRTAVKCELTIDNSEAV